MASITQQAGGVSIPGDRGEAAAAKPRGIVSRVGLDQLPFYVGFFLLALFGILGVSPWLAPALYDNVTYFETAKSLLAGDGYRLNGEIVADWPPLHPLLLAMVFAIGGVSVVLAKLVSLAAALLAICLAYTLLVREGRAMSGFAIGLLAVMSTSLLTAVRVSSDWTFAALAFGFLIVVDAMRSRRGTGTAIAAGVLLGAASLTRYPGVLLGVALVAQAIAVSWRARSVKAAAPEAVAALTGLLIWTAWVAYLLLKGIEGQVAEGDYEDSGALLFGHFGVLDLAVQWSDLLFQWGILSAALGLSATAAAWIAMIPVALMAIGFAARGRQRRLSPSDWYVVATLLLLVMYYWKVGRYFIPVAPFLLCYLLDGARVVGRPILRAKLQPCLHAAIAMWIGGTVAVSANLLFWGESAENGPLSPLASPSPGHFYRASWSDLYLAGEFVRAQGGGVVAIEEEYQKYALPWFGASRAVGPDADEWDFKVLPIGDGGSEGDVVYQNEGLLVIGREVDE